MFRLVFAHGGHFPYNFYQKILITTISECENIIATYLRNSTENKVYILKREKTHLLPIGHAQLTQEGVRYVYY